jgi:hypothetical protein
MSLDPKAERRDLPLELDSAAESADPSLPGFLARPEDEPVYHGFRIVDEVEVEGFKLGAISSFDGGAQYGDAFIVAPDGSRAGLVWDVGPGSDLRVILPFEKKRWGVWGISFPRSIDNVDDVGTVLEKVVPLLRPRWEEWKRLFNG